MKKRETTIRDIIDKFQNKIPVYETELLIAKIFGITREEVLAHPEKILTANIEKKCDLFCKMRINQFPIAYIVGEKYFFGLRFLINKNVLVPRPETECLVSAVHDFLKKEKKFHPASVFDIGTGSGCIAITIAKTCDEKIVKTVYAGDISKKALSVAEKNQKIQKTSIKFKQGDLLIPFKTELKNVKNKIIVANLPYVTETLYKKEPSIRKEPKKAIVAKKFGLYYYVKLLKQYKTIQKEIANNPGRTCLFFEINPEQKQKIHMEIKKYFPYAKIIFLKDLAKRNRIVRVVL